MSQPNGYSNTTAFGVMRGSTSWPRGSEGECIGSEPFHRFGIGNHRKKLADWERSCIKADFHNFDIDLQRHFAGFDEKRLVEASGLGGREGGSI